MAKKKYEEFEMYKEKLDEIYEKDPERATLEAYNSLVRLGVVDGKKKKLTKSDKFIAYFMLVSFAILCLGFFNISTIGIYFFGFVFFIAGLCVCLFTGEKFGIIFLFSHGCTGLAVMIGSLLGVEFFNNPLFQDNPVNLIVYLVIVGLILFGAIVYTIYLALIGSNKNNYKVFIPLCFYGLSLLLIGIFPYIISLVYNFRI